MANDCPYQWRSESTGITPPGSEGSTGLSSPKRYLWDEKFYGQGGV
jgi:hypothetical protein